MQERTEKERKQSINYHGEQEIWTTSTLLKLKPQKFKLMAYIFFVALFKPTPMVAI